MIEYKKGSTIKVPVRLLDSTGAPVIGKTYTDVSMSVLRSDGTVLSPSLSAPDFVEITTGAFLGQGFYTISPPLASIGVSGLLVYAVKVTGADTYIGAVKIVDKEEVDTFIVADTLRKYEEGRWKIVRTQGDPDYGKLILYDPADNTTVLKKFLIKDDSGTINPDKPFERTPTA